MIVHCFFEQSGTFKNQFKKLGIEAYDYDIKNDFGETDYVIDLFAEIDKCFAGGGSIFDKISQDDLIMAFFPCVRFEEQILLSFRGQNNGMKNWSLQKKLDNAMKLHDELSYMYKLTCKMFHICKQKSLKLIMENPYSKDHYLRKYWCVFPAVIDMNRRERGDYFKKPTQYFFLNCEPKNNLILEATPNNAIKTKGPIRSMKAKDYKKLGVKNRQVARSMIHPDYANRFIREYILEDEKEQQEV